MRARIRRRHRSGLRSHVCVRLTASQGNKTLHGAENESHKNVLSYESDDGRADRVAAGQCCLTNTTAARQKQLASRKAPANTVFGHRYLNTSAIGGRITRAQRRYGLLKLQRDVPMRSPRSCGSPSTTSVHTTCAALPLSTSFGNPVARPLPCRSASLMRWSCFDRSGV